MKLKFVDKGRFHTVYAIERNGRCEFEKFINALTENAKKSLTAFIKRMTSIEHLQDLTQWKQLKNGLFEIKIQSTPAVRVFCFIHPTEDYIVILTHGMKKSNTREQAQEIARALSLKEEFERELDE